MRKFTILMASVLTFSLLLTACGKNGGSSQASVAPTSPGSASGESSAPAAPSDDLASKKVTISITYPTPDQSEMRKQEDDKMKRFKEKYPNVEFVKNDWAYNPNEIGIKMGANEAPTLFSTYATEGKFLVEKGWVADITDLFNNYEYKDQMNPILQNQFVIDGKVYGIADNGYVTGVVINKKMLADKGVPIPPLDWTWDDMYNTAKAVADPAKGIAGIAPMGKGNEAGWNWTNFLFEAGGEIQTVEGGKVTAAFNSDAGVKALDFYNKLRWDANAIPQDWALGWGDAVGAFAQGRAAMVIAGPDGPVDQALNQGGMKPEDLLVYPMPAAQAGGKHTGVLGGNYWVINPNASKDEQAIAFRYIVFDYFSEDLQASVKTIEDRKKDGKFYIPTVFRYFKDDSEYGIKVKELYKKYDNVYLYDSESMKLFDGKPEAQFNTQDYYNAMTTVIQEVFSKKNADLKGLLDATAKLVQEKFYDSIKVQ